MEEILKIQNNVNEHSKRKLNRITSLKIENMILKKQKVNEVRENVKNEVINLINEPTTFAKPRDQIVSDVKKRLSLLWFIDSRSKIDGMNFMYMGLKLNLL